MKNLTKLIITGACLASLASSGCENVGNASRHPFTQGLLFNAADRAIAGQQNSNSNRNQDGTQWIDINGRLGYINCQGYGLVPAGDKSYYVYKYENGSWVGIAAEISSGEGVNIKVTKER